MIPDGKTFYFSSAATSMHLLEVYKLSLNVGNEDVKLTGIGKLYRGKEDKM
jgi:hypothetical protein